MANEILSVASVFQTIGSVLLAILILLVMITIHEFGHWIAGKVMHFGIDEFSIGFGPAIFKRKSKKSGQVFALRIIPLGGYCSFQGEDGLEEEEDPFFSAEEQEAQRISAEEQEVKKEEQEQGTLAKRKKRVPEWKSKPDNGSFTRKAPWKRIIVLVAGALMNYLLALLLIMICFGAYGQTMYGVYFAEGATEEIAEEYCLQDQDIFLSVNGKKVYLATDLVKALNNKKAGDKVTMRVSRIETERVTGDDGVERCVAKEGAKRHETVITVVLRADVQIKNSSQIDGVWKALGVEYRGEENGNYQLASKNMRFGFFETIGRSFVYSFKLAGSILKVLGELLTGNIGIKSFGGPVTTVVTASQVVSRGFEYFLGMAALIGVNLAVFNLLPIPALDGSKVVFTAIEWVRGKPISRKVEAIIHAAGFILLLGFAVLVDILQFV